MKMLRSISSLAALAAVASLAAPAAAQDTLIRAGKVYTIAGDVLSPGAVLIRDGKIVRVAGAIDDAPGATVIDLSDGVLMPGLVDPYTHLGLTGGDVEFTEEVTPAHRVHETIDWGDRAFERALASGITSAAVAPGTDNVIAGIGAIVKTAGANPDARTVNADAAFYVTICSDPRGMNPGSRNRSRGRPDTIYIRQPTNRMGVVWIFREYVHALRLGEDAEGNPMLAALDGEMPLFSVSRTSFDLETVLRLGAEFDFQAIPVGAEEATKVAAALAERGTAVILGPARTTAGTGPEGTDVIFNRAGTLNDAGVVAAFSGGNLLEQAMFARRFGQSENAALEAITMAPARLLRADDRIGSIAVGRDADLLALSGDPLSPFTSIRWVMVDGVIRHQVEE